MAEVAILLAVEVILTPVVQDDFRIQEEGDVHRLILWSKEPNREGVLRSAMRCYAEGLLLDGKSGTVKGTLYTPAPGP